MAMTATVFCQPFNRIPPFRFLGTSSHSAFVCNSSKSPIKETKVTGLNFKEKKNCSEFGGYRLLRTAATGRDGSSATELDEDLRKFLQAILWIAECVYIIWLFLLPYAPGDPVWAISSDTIKDLVGLSLNFFFILPLSNSVGVHLLEAPVLHPMSEGLFNFVVGWTLMFAPLLYTDCKRNRFKGSLDILWSLQMFLTNTFLIPYMAIRLNNTDSDTVSGNKNTSKLGSIMINGSSIIGLTGGVVCVFSILWALFGRADANISNISERIDFLTNYLGSERLAYAFIWDIVLYTVFQPWLIGDNLKNIQQDKVRLRAVGLYDTTLRFVFMHRTVLLIRVTKGSDPRLCNPSINPAFADVERSRPHVAVDEKDQAEIICGRRSATSSKLGEGRNSKSRGSDLVLTRLEAECRLKSV